MRRVGIRELLDSPEEIAELSRVLRAGGVAAVPTETFYGLAADPRSEAGVARVRAMKGRESDKALLVLFAERRQLDGLGILARRETLDRFFAVWPAPLTVVLPLSAAIPASCGASTLAVRMPAHGPLRELLARVGPLTGTSLNRSGEPPCRIAEDAAGLLDTEIDVFVDGGATPGGLPSTLLDATREPPVVLRQGAFVWPAGPC
ncbi:MAG: L-threonylcarbamoyladenylate synthase [Acidobacteriota bacterium]